MCNIYFLRSIIIRSDRRSDLCLQNLIHSDRGEVNIFCVVAVTSAIIGIMLVALAVLLLTTQVKRQKK